jgi:hypothetical protein
VLIGASPATPVVAEESVGTPVEIDVDGRWDALALSELLVPFHSFLVQDTTERWVVHARAPGCHGERLADALLASAPGWSRDALARALYHFGMRGNTWPYPSSSFS